MTTVQFISGQAETEHHLIRFAKRKQTEREKEEMLAMLDNAVVDSGLTAWDKASAIIVAALAAIGCALLGAALSAALALTPYVAPGSPPLFIMVQM